MNLVQFRYGLLKVHSMILHANPKPSMKIRTTSAKFQLSILKIKKVLFLKIIFFSRYLYQSKKCLFTDSIFRDGFAPTFRKNGATEIFTLQPISEELCSNGCRVMASLALVIGTGKKICCIL